MPESPAERLRERVAEALPGVDEAWGDETRSWREVAADTTLAALAAHITEGRDEAADAYTEAFFDDGVTRSDALRAFLTALGLPSPEPGA